MAVFEMFIASLQEYLWSFPMLILLFGTHIYFTIRLKFIQKMIPRGIRFSFSRQSKRAGQESVSSYEALATALAATIGTGNIVGVSTAIAIGGPGAVFWCWLTGFFGIATCYAECFLSVKYQRKQEDGSCQGGPMYVLEHVLHKKGMAVVFALFTMLASFGIGSSVQAHSIQMAAARQVTISPHLTGILAGVLTGMVIVGGNKKIAGVCTWLVPVMSVLYLGGCLWIIAKNRTVIPETLFIILKAAFSSQAVVGGVAGRAVMTGMRTGISRGLFTNEAGLGSIPMAAAAVREAAPVKQSLISMTGPFWDTVVMCAITGIAAVSSMVKYPKSYQGAKPEDMCFIAFRELPVCGEEILSVCLILFAFATMIGWNVYGTSAVRYLWGERAVKTYQVLYMLFVYFGAVLSLNLVWGIADLFNSFMAVPNLFCIWMLQSVIVKETEEILKKE